MPGCSSRFAEILRPVERRLLNKPGHTGGCYDRPCSSISSVGSFHKAKCIIIGNALGYRATNVAQATLTFPPDFLWGTATSAYQVEGNNTNSDWWVWEQTAGHIANGDRSGQAADWWNNAEADLEAAARLGTNTIRLSLEWSRIEPEPSVFDDQALARYREILQACHDHGLKPMVTLHHFSNPLWLNEKGDFSASIVVDYFRRYAAKVASTLGDLIPLWITLNEPVNYAFQRYLVRTFPKGEASGWSALVRAIHHMLRCHAAAYRAIKSSCPDAQVGGAHYMAAVAPIPKSNRLDRVWARWLSRLLNDAWPDSLKTGYLTTPLGGIRVKDLAGTSDFIGINYYGRYYVKFPPAKGFVEHHWPDDAIVGDNAYHEVYPYGLYQAIRRANKRYGQPIYITSNGLPDRADHLRPGFILDHLRQVWHAISFCYPVMGYYHWSLIDGFAWHRGWTQRYGLIELDPETQLRSWRDSAYLYQAISQSGTISSAMAAQFAPEMLAEMFPGSAPDAV